MARKDNDRPHLQPALSVDDRQSLRDDERRRLARDLHDGTSQTLVALQLQLGRLRRLDIPEAEPIISESEKIISEIREQIRTIGRD